MSSTRYFLEKGNEHLERALDAERRKDFSEAKREYSLAAEYFLKAAKNSEEDMKEARIEQAERLLRKAENLPEDGNREYREKDEIGKKNDAENWIMKEKPNVRFDDVAGLEDVKEVIRTRVIYPFKEGAAAKKFGIRVGGGVLLYGPPGTGKTYIAKAIATEINAVFFTVRPSQIMSSWVGEAERNISKLFEEARNEEKAIIFIDEIDSMLPRRSSSWSTVMKRVVPQFLAEMDGVSTSGVGLLFMAATNVPWDLDPAVLRPGRFDEKIYVPPPDFDARQRLFEIYLRKKPLDADVEIGKLAEVSEGYSGADISFICAKAAERPFRDKVERGIERNVSMEDLMVTIQDTKPSISIKELKKYTKYMEDV